MYRLYFGSSTSTLNWWGLRFLNVDVPQGAMIASATITFRASEASVTTASGMTLWGQLATNPATFNDSSNNITSRPRTTATAAWSVPQWTSGSDYATPSLAAIVQEIVDQSGWAANNALVIIGQTTVTQNRRAISRDNMNGETLAPLLEVCYTQAPAGPIITSASSLPAFSTRPGVASAVQTYTVSGSNLTGDVTITPPADFELSTTSGSGFGTSPLTLTPTSGSVPATTIYVRFNRATVGTSSGNITHTSSGATTKNVPVSGTASTANHAPNPPVFVQPADDATDVSTSPTLEVTVTDSDSDPMNVSFYGRAVGETADEDFTVIALPDTQNYSTAYPAVFNSQTQWIANNKTAQNIVFVTHLGDIVNIASSTTEYNNADAAMDLLDTGNVAYSVGPGNHDYPLTNYNLSQYFGVSRFSGKSYYGGSYGAGNENNYSLFSASGMDFILINLEYHPGTAAMDWADALLKANSTRRGIVVSHSIIDVDDINWTYPAVYTALKDNPNLFLMLCGHMHTPTDGAARRTETGDNGNTIYILQSDYQDYAPYWGNGYLRIMRFALAVDKIYVTTYSPYLPGSLTDAQNEFELAYDMAGALPFELIGAVSGVVSGGNASISWPGRAQGAAYEWYAVVSDGTLAMTGSTWSFTTAALPKAPVVTSIAIAGNGAKLIWNPVTWDIKNNPTAILKYQVYGSQDPFFTPSGNPLGEPTVTEFTHGGGPTGMTNWYYQVRAVNVIGPSADSKLVGKFTFPIVPGQ